MLWSRYVYNKENCVKSIRKEKCQKPRGKWLFPSFSLSPTRSYLFLSNRCHGCPEILTRPVNENHSQSVPARHSSSAATIFRQKLDGFLITFCFVFARNRPVGITGEYRLRAVSLLLENP